MKSLKILLAASFIIGIVLLILNIVCEFDVSVLKVAGIMTCGGGFLLVLLGGIGNNDSNNEK